MNVYILKLFKRKVMDAGLSPELELDFYRYLYVIYKLDMLGADLICGRWSAGVSAPSPRLETALARVHLLYE